MIRRAIATALFLGLLARPVSGPGRGSPPKRAENVIVVTLDGFRHQEFFAGADESLIDAKAGGVPDAGGLKRRFWRETAEARRECLLPFLWGTRRQGGADLRRSLAPRPGAADQRHEVLVPRLQRDVLRVRRRADRLQRQEGQPEPLGPGVPRRPAGLPGPGRGVLHLGRVPVHLPVRPERPEGPRRVGADRRRAAQRPPAAGQPDAGAAAALLAGQRLRRDHDGGRAASTSGGTSPASCSSGWARPTSGPTGGATTCTSRRPTRPIASCATCGRRSRRCPSTRARRP